MANSIGNLSAKVTANAGAFNATMVKCQADAEAFAESLRKQSTAAAMGAQQFQQYQMALAGVSKETRDQISMLQKEAEWLDAIDRDLKRNEASAARLGSAGAGAMRGLSGGSTNALFAVQQLAFGAQDAATVFGTQGFAGAVRASSNNLVQFGSLISPMAGIALAGLATVIGLIVDNWDKWSDSLGNWENKLAQAQKATITYGEIAEDVGKRIKNLTEVEDLDTTKSIDKKIKELADERKLNARMIDELWTAIQSERSFTHTKEELQKMPKADREAAKKNDLERSAEIARLEHKRIELENRQAEIGKFGDVTIKLEEQRNIIGRKEEEERLKKADKKNFEDSMKISEEENRELEQIAKETARAEKARNDYLYKVAEDGANAESKVLLRAEKRIEELRALGFDAETEAELIEQIFGNAESDLAEIQKHGIHKGQKASVLAGAAELGSKEAFGRAAEQYAGRGESRMDENIAKQVELAKMQLEEMRKVEAAVKDPPVRVVQF